MNAMMRITTLSHSPDEVILKIEGWVSGEDVDLLKQEGEHWLQQAKRLVLDLSGVKSIDSRGVTLLQRWPEEQLILRGQSSFVRMLLHRA
jgi:ABC-type transporter Mla MlaB component